MALYMVQMEVRLPEAMDAARADELRAREREVALQIQREGRWPHLWRVVGRYANVSIFDVADNDELHRLLTSLPLYPYMDVRVTPLTTHPSALNAQS